MTHCLYQSQPALSVFAVTVFLCAPSARAEPPSALTKARSLITTTQVVEAPKKDELIALLEEAEQEELATEADKEAAKKEAEAQSLVSDKIASGKLIEYGVTGGVATLVHIPFKRDWGQTRIESGHIMDVTPYVVVLPRYMFGQTQEQNKYCASRWTTTEAEAQRAADTMARERGKVMAQALVERFAAGQDVGEAAEILQTAADSDPDVRALIIELASSANGTDDKAKAALAALESILAERVLGWVPGVAGSCWAHSIGFWFTPIPANKTLDVRRGRTPGVVGEAKAKRWISFGLAWVPTAYVSLLAGASYGSLSLESQTDQGVAKTDSIVRFWSMSAGLSVNADILTVAN